MAGALPEACPGSHHGDPPLRRGVIMDHARSGLPPRLTRLLAATYRGAALKRLASFSLILILLLLGACAGPARVDPSGGAAAPGRKASPAGGQGADGRMVPARGEAGGARIVLARGERPGRWRATYELEAATGFLRFQRPASFYREGVWEIVTPGWRLAREGDLQVLVAEPGAEADRVVVELPVHTEPIPKEYELFLSFTDGSVALYTGHLYVTTSPPEVSEDEAAFLRRLELIPRPGEKLVLQGRTLAGRTTWEDPHGEGTYIYFGTIRPLETPDMIGIIDPGAPPWLVRQMREMLPRVFALYTEGLRGPLPWKPVVLFSFEDRDVPGLSSGGGTLEGLVQMSAVGSGWHQATPDASEQLLYLVAHEAAHFWNGQLHTYHGMADSWMHEGSADAMASLVLSHLGFIDEARLGQRWNRALNACARGLRDGSLSSSLHRQQFDNYYVCGEMIALWSVAAVSGTSSETASPLDELFRVWRTVFEASGPDGGHYSRDTYMRALASLGAGEPDIEALRAFIDTEHDDPSAALIAFMGRVGLELQTPDRPLPEQRPEWAAALLQHLMSTNCGGRFSFNREGPWLHSSALVGCDPFSRELLIVAIEEHGPGDGDLAFHAGAQRCSEGLPVTLGLQDGTQVPVPCKVAPPPQPAPLAIP